MIEISSKSKYKKALVVTLATRTAGNKSLHKPTAQFTVKGMTIDQLYGVLFCSVEDYKRAQEQNK